MERTVTGQRHHEDDDDLDDRELPDESDMDDDDGGDSVDTEPCPFCGKPIYEQAQVCPHCGNYICIEDVRSSRKPLWFIIGAIVAIAVVVLVWVL